MERLSERRTFEVNFLFLWKPYSSGVIDGRSPLYYWVLSI